MLVIWVHFSLIYYILQLECVTPFVVETRGYNHRHALKEVKIGVSLYADTPN